MDGLRICQELIVRPERHSFLLGANESSWPNEILLFPFKPVLAFALHFDS